MEKTFSTKFEVTVFLSSEDELSAAFVGDPTNAQINLVKAVKELAMIHPEKRFCIRLHPKQRAINNFKLDYSLDNIPGNILISESGDSDSLIQETRIAIGIHSTVLMRALLLEKIVITYDNAWYSQLSRERISLLDNDLSHQLQNFIKRTYLEGFENVVSQIQGAILTLLMGEFNLSHVKIKGFNAAVTTEFQKPNFNI